MYREPAECREIRQIAVTNSDRDFVYEILTEDGFPARRLHLASLCVRLLVPYCGTRSRHILDATAGLL
jgi:hypothetical protein